MPSTTSSAAEDPVLRLGLLMESAQAQQQAAESALERLEEQVRGLDQVVRDQIRQALLESLHELTDCLRQAEASVMRLARAAGLRSLLVPCLAAACCAAGPVGLAWWLLPSPAEIRELEQQRQQLRRQIAQLDGAGGTSRLRRCGKERICVRVDTHAPPFGAHGEYRVLAGD